MEQKKSVFNSVKKAWKNGVNKMKKFFRTGKEKKSSSLQPSSNANQPIPDESDNSIKTPNPSSPLEASFSPILPVKSDSSKENLSTSTLPPPPPPLPPSPPSTSFRGTGREMPEDRRRVAICASDLVEARARLRPVGERKTVGRNEVNMMESPSTSVDSHTTNMPPSPTPPPPSPPPPPPSPTLQPSSPLPPTAENRSDVPRRVEICASDLLEARAKLKPVGERRKVGTNEVGAENLSTSFSSRKDSEKNIERPPVKSDNHEELPQLPPTSPVDPDVELQLRLIDKQLKRIKSLLSILEGEGTASAEQPFEPRTTDSTSQKKQLHLNDLIDLIQEEVRKIEFLVSVLESQGTISAASPSPDSTTPPDHLRLIEEHVRKIEFLVSLLDSPETISVEQPHEEPQVSPSSPDSTNRVEIIDETQSNFNFGLDLFHRVNGGKLAEKDKFECCAKLDGKYKDMFLIFTNNRILVASAKGKIKWQTKWNKIKGSSPIVHDEDENVDMLTFEYKSPKYVFRRSTFCEFYVVKTEKTFLLEPGQQHFLDYYSRN